VRQTDRRTDNADHYYSWYPHSGEPANNLTQSAMKSNAVTQKACQRDFVFRVWSAFISSLSNVNVCTQVNVSMPSAYDLGHHG